MRFLVAGLAVLLTAAGAAAADRKVPSANYATIQAAADAAGSGDSITIAKGVYFENVTMTQTNVKIVGKGAIIDGNIGGTEGVCLTVTGNNCSVSGITFRHGTRHLVMTGSALTVSKCRFLRNASYIDNVLLTGAGATVTGCTSVGALDTVFAINGDNATVTKNKISYAGQDGIVITGTGATVTKNTITMIEDNESINITGNNATVTGNKISFTDGSAINVDSDDSTVSGNTCFATGDTCIHVLGDRVTVTSNKVSNTVDDADAFQVESRTPAGLGLVEKNTATDCIEFGFYLSKINHVVVRGNKATRCGSEQEACFYIEGDFNTIDGNTATDGEDDGFYVGGNSNVLTNDKATNCQTDGFEIVSAANSLDGCTATGCGGEGLDNKGTLTAVSNCTFLKNRIDFAADLANGATFGIGGNNKIGTGNTGTQDEVD